MDKNFRYFFEIDTRLLNYFPDGSVINYNGEIVSVIQELDNAVLFSYNLGELMNSDGFDLNASVTVGLTLENISDLLNSWFLNNRLMKIVMSSHFYIENEILISEKLEVAGFYLSRPSGYSSIVFPNDKSYRLVPDLFRSRENYSYTVCSVEDVSGLFIPNEFEIQTFHDVYIPPKKFLRLLTP
jgi:hypothetical protein